MDPEYTAVRESWRGASYDEVVAAWGPPGRSVQSGAQQNHIWLTEDRVPAPQRAGSGAGGVLFGAAPGDVAMRCERTLVVQDARVVREGEWSGDPAFCKRFARPRR
jgi:hypothetical protein